LSQIVAASSAQNHSGAAQTNTADARNPFCSGVKKLSSDMHMYPRQDLLCAAQVLSLNMLLWLRAVHNKHPKHDVTVDALPRPPKPRAA
jgi:hypothetical protein